VKAFSARLEPAPRGGHYVVVPAELVEGLGLRHGARVRGSINGVRYRSSLMKYSGVFYLGVHQATVEEAGAKLADLLRVSIELDTEPLPTDSVPEDLARALERNSRAAAAWQVLRPSARREHVQSVIDAKKPETRERRIQNIVATLSSRG
jgi:hypothetical protein